MCASLKGDGLDSNQRWLPNRFTVYRLGPLGHHLLLKKKPMNGTFTRVSEVFQPLPPAYIINKTKVFAHRYYTPLN